MKHVEVKLLTNYVGNAPALSVEFVNHMNDTIPLVSKEKNIIIHEGGRPFGKILVIESGLVAAFETFGENDNQICYLWRSAEVVVFPSSFFEPKLPTDYFIQTLQRTEFWIIDDVQWREMKRNFKKDCRRLQIAMYANFIQTQEELRVLLSKSDREKYRWFEEKYGRNFLQNGDTARFLGIKPRTFDRIKNGK